jgi:hypothetical protein
MVVIIFQALMGILSSGLLSRENVSSTIWLM